MDDDHIVTLTAARTSAERGDYIFAIRSISYNNLADEPDETPRFITIGCSDGVLDSNPSAVVTVNIQVTNDSPYVDLNGGNVPGKDLVFSYTEGDVESVLAPQLLIVDPDSTTVVNATIQIVEVFDMDNETLNFQGQTPAGIITCSPSTCDGASIVLTGNAALNDYQDFLRTLAYTNFKVPQELPDLRDRQVEISVSDGSASVSCIIDIDFLATVPRAIIDLDAPNVNYTTTFTEGSTSGIRICNLNTIRSADSSVDNLLAVEVSLRDRELEAEERIFIARAEQVQLNVSVETNFALKTISFKGSTVDSYIAAIQSIQYITEADEPRDVIRYVDVVSIPGGGVPNTLATAIINITLINDNAPEFANVTYSTSIREDANITSSVFNFSVVDRDSGRDGEFAFQIIDGNDDGTFEINSETGLLSLAEMLDFENQTVYFVTVEVEDFGTIVGPLSNRQNLTISVIDVNDNAPMFEQDFYNVSFPENTTGLILMFNISDLDSGMNEQIGNLQVINSSGILFGDPSIPSLNTSGLDFENQQVHLVTVIAFDAGSPHLSGTTVVQIYVIDIDDFPPVFNQSLYVFNIDEDNSVNDTVGRVFATDSDSGQNLTYISLDPNFAIDMFSGVITIQVVASLPSTPRFLFNVTALDVLGNRATPSEVQVIVNDINNNPTVLDFSAADNSTFNAVNCTVFVEESPPQTLNIDLAITDEDQIPLEISTITARIIDPLDVEEYLLVNYSPVAVNGNRTSSLIIQLSPPESDLNEITDIINSLFYGNDATEPTSSVGNDRTIEVNITDNIGQTSTAQACVEFSYTNDIPLLDLNNVIAGTGNEIRYTEDGPPILLTNQPQIIDPDNINFTSLNISLTALDSGEFLLITADTPLSQTGNLTSFISLQGTGSRDVYLEALRSIYYASSNDNPTETNRNVSFTISDGTSISPPAVTVVQYSTVGDLPILDLDGDNFMSQNFSTTFIEEGRPVAITNGASIFDGDDDELQYLQVTINGGYSTEDVIIINSTIFPEAAFVFPNITILQVASIDNYTRFINELFYQNTADEIFDTSSRYITFSLQDATGNFSDVVSTTVALQPIDDHSPSFTVDNVTVNLLENSTNGTIVAQLNITDEDLGETPDHSCFISSTSPLELMNAFFVNITLSSQTRRESQFSVDVVLREAVDRELYESVTVLIRCSIATVIINATLNVRILDVNDNSPVGFNFTVNYTITENQPAFTPLTPSFINVTDVDVSSRLTYSVSYDPTGIVGVNSTTGELFAVAPFDREMFSVSYYIITICVSDGYYQIYISILLYLIDVNDNPPYFDPSDYNSTLIENQMPLYPVVNVTVVDIDQTAVYDLVIVDGPFSNNFTINSRGEIRLITPLDHEANNSFTLVISANDTNNISFAYVNFEVLNENDERPVIEPDPSLNVIILYDDDNITVTEVIIVVLENRDVSDVLYTVRATDPDPDASLSYSFINTSTTSFPFAIDNSTGQIRVDGLLDAETERIFSAVLLVRDINGHVAYPEAHTADVNVTFIIEDVNDVPPVFSQGFYDTTIRENSSINTTLDLSIAANDSDYGMDSLGNNNGNAEVEFFISQDDIPFSINSTNGLLTLSRSLDRETEEYYNFTVMAHDLPISGTSLTATASVTIRVLNINDNPPVADPNNYTACVSENTENVSLETSVPLNLQNGKFTMIDDYITLMFIVLYSASRFLLSTSN